MSSSSSILSSRSSTLSLYRSLLRTIAVFPSKKRAAIRADIIIEFREGKTWTDSARITSALGVAHDGLVTMRKYTNLDKNGREWVVNLDPAPLRVAGGEVEQRLMTGEFESQGGGQVKKL